MINKYFHSEFYVVFDKDYSKFLDLYEKWVESIDKAATWKSKENCEDYRDMFCDNNYIDKKSILVLPVEANYEVLND